MLTRTAPNYKNSHPLVITLRLSLYPDRTLGEHVKKWRLEQGLFQRDLAKLIGVNEMTIVNWEKGGAKPNWDTISTHLLVDFSCRLRLDQSHLASFQSLEILIEILDQLFNGLPFRIRATH
jgi:DNA-binding XRE family transcriptional regulator